ncbi:MAG: MBL fold metallo-hydrolase [Planctomycetes bacterium]|nr:MBL fold metallo-hydrolase [Planctomycetota bacterium]
MKITVIGHSSCIPDVGKEMACLLINGKHLIDTGWCAALKMREFGFDPLELESILITHFHQDHYLGLPQLLFYIGLRGKKEERGPLNLVGPADHLERIVKAAEDLQQIPRFPELEVKKRLVPVVPGDSFDLGDLHIDTCAANHMSGHKRQEQAIVYKVTDESGACFVCTGDTHPHPPIAEFAKGVPLLIHDGGHTPAEQAAEVAKQAGVGRLLLIHYPESAAEQKRSEARNIFPNTDLAKEGTTLEV